MSGIAVFGITGRMGQSLIRALREANPPLDLRLCAAIASAQSDRLGQDAALDGPPTGLAVTADVREGLEAADVALDFSRADSVARNARACSAANVPLLVGATGFDAAARADLAAASRGIAVLIAPNTSFGVALMTRLTKVAAGMLGEEFDVEISEAHHRQKRDAPSGTALSLGEAVASARGVTLGGVAVFDRHARTVARQAGEIGFSSTRGGDIVGEHTVCFAGSGERLEFTHRATDRMIFARGALRGARWLIGRRPGLYTMDDVLGLTSGMDSHPTQR